VAFELLERGIPRNGYEIKNASGENIGKVTSGTQSPSLSIGIGLGYVATAYSKPETEIFIQIRNHLIPAKVVKLPFYKAQ